MKRETAAVSNRRAVFEKRSRGFLANHQRLPEREPRYLLSGSIRRSARWSPLPTMKVCACWNLSTVARPNANYRFCEIDCEQMSCRVSIVISLQRANRLQIISPEGIWNLL